MTKKSFYKKMSKHQIFFSFEATYVCDERKPRSNSAHIALIEIHISSFRVNEIFDVRITMLINVYISLLLLILLLFFFLQRKVAKSISKRKRYDRHNEFLNQQRFNVYIYYTFHLFFIFFSRRLLRRIQQTSLFNYS